MNPLANTVLVFSTGLMLMMLAAVNCKSNRVRLSEFKQWLLATDMMDRIAAGLVFVAVPGVLAANWMANL